VYSLDPDTMVDSAAMVPPLHQYHRDCLIL
jgi:hypothetical protein